MRRARELSIHELRSCVGEKLWDGSCNVNKCDDAAGTVLYYSRVLRTISPSLDNNW